MSNRIHNLLEVPPLPVGGNGFRSGGISLEQLWGGTGRMKENGKASARVLWNLRDLQV